MDYLFKKGWLNVIGWVFVGLFFLLLALGFSKRGIYSSKIGINMVVMGDSGTALVLLRPQEGVMTWVKMPDNLSVKISGSGAVYPLSSLWKYGVMEKSAYKIVTTSLSSTIGVLLPRVIKIKGEVSPENLLGSMHKIGLQTNLSIRDRVLVRRDLVASVASKRYLEIDVPLSALDKAEDPDGKEFVEINYVINLWTKNKFVFDQLLGENSTIKIYNLTPIKGAGLLLSRQLESSGLRVVEVSSDYLGNKPKRSGCHYVGAQPYPNTQYLLESYANCKNISDKDFSAKGEGIEIWIL